MLGGPTRFVLGSRPDLGSFDRGATRGDEYRSRRRQSTGKGPGITILSAAGALREVIRQSEA